MATEDPVERAASFVIDNWPALGVTEHRGILHLPTSIKRRNASGGVDEVPVALRNVTHEHKFKSRTTARAYALRLKLDLDRDAGLVEEIENYSLLAYAIRDPQPPHDQHVPHLDALLELYDTQSLAEIWGRYNTWVDMLDPRFGELSSEQLWQTVVRIAKERDPGFLCAMPGYAQGTFIVAMAREALHSPNRPSWLQSSSTSNAA